MKGTLTTIKKNQNPNKSEPSAETPADFQIKAPLNLNFITIQKSLGNLNYSKMLKTAFCS